VNGALAGWIAAAVSAKRHYVENLRTASTNTAWMRAIVDQAADRATSDMLPGALGADNQDILYALTLIEVKTARFRIRPFASCSTIAARRAAQGRVMLHSPEDSRRRHAAGGGLAERFGFGVAPAFLYLARLSGVDPLTRLGTLVASAQARHVGDHGSRPARPEAKHRGGAPADRHRSTAGGRRRWRTAGSGAGHPVRSRRLTNSSTGCYGI
jgi:hypothetical protein